MYYSECSPQIFQTAPEAVQTATLSSGKGARQVRVPVDHLRAASTLSAFLCCPSMFDCCQADEGRRFYFLPYKATRSIEPKNAAPSESSFASTQRTHVVALEYGVMLWFCFFTAHC